MAVPATTGQLRTRVPDLMTGDYIVCDYTSIANTVGTFSNIGGQVLVEIPTLGTESPYGSFYFIKVDKGLLVADRVVQVFVSWDVLNAGRVIQGKPQTFGTVSGIIRSLTGGVAYADSDGNKATTEQGYGGWPTNNEWDTYIVNFPSYLIQSGKTLDDVFHVDYNATFCQDPAMVGLKHVNTPTLSATYAHRIFRGVETTSNTHKTVGFASSNIAYGWVGFRPVFEYKEV